MRSFRDTGRSRQVSVSEGRAAAKECAEACAPRRNGFRRQELTQRQMGGYLVIDATAASGQASRKRAGALRVGEFLTKLVRPADAAYDLIVRDDRQARR